MWKVSQYTKNYLPITVYAKKSRLVITFIFIIVVFIVIIIVIAWYWYYFHYYQILLTIVLSFIDIIY